MILDICICIPAADRHSYISLRALSKVGLIFILSSMPFASNQASVLFPY